MVYLAEVYICVKVLFRMSEFVLLSSFWFWIL